MPIDNLDLRITKNLKVILGPKNISSRIASILSIAIRLLLLYNNTNPYYILKDTYNAMHFCFTTLKDANKKRIG